MDHHKKATELIEYMRVFRDRDVDLCIIELTADHVSLDDVAIVQQLVMSESQHVDIDYRIWIYTKLDKVLSQKYKGF